MQHAIEVTNACVTYRQRSVLKGISLEIRRKGRVGIFGPNGAGKTTLLTAINGLVPLSVGAIRILDVHPTPRTWPGIRKRIGYVPQEIEVDRAVPVPAADVVMMGRLGKIGLFRRPRADDKRCIRETMEQLDILDLSQCPFGELSGGQKQKVLIARALAQEPEILLLDEPFSSLDGTSRRLITDRLLKAHAEAGLTMLIVSHDEESLPHLCERIICLEHGHIVRS